MTEKEMLELARQKQKAGRENVQAGFGSNYRSCYETESNDNSLSAREKMKARQMTNPERMRAESEARKQKAAEVAAQKEALEKMTPYERDLERAKIRKQEDRERWAVINGWRDYAEYEEDQRAKRNR